MAYLQEQMKILKFDKRMLEINLKNGSLTEDEYNQHLAQLQNVESESETMRLDDGKAVEAEAPAAPQPAQASPFTPPNNDPFGSGF